MRNKKIFIMTEEQEKLLLEMIERENTLPKFLCNDIENYNTSLSDFFDVQFKSYLHDIVKQRYENVLSYFKDDISSVKVDDVIKKLQKLIIKAQKIEEGVKPQLEKLCYDTVKTLFNFNDDDFEFECVLTQSIDNLKQFNVEPNGFFGEDETYNNVSDIKLHKDIIRKRLFLNALSEGCAMSLGDKCKEIYLNRLFDIDEELPHLYSKIMKINEYLLFKKKIKVSSKNHCQGGYVDITIGDDVNNTKITSTGIIFPMLLEQSIKGVLDLVISNSLPNDVNKMRKLINHCDTISHEQWNMILGPALFNRIFSKVADLNSEDIPYLTYYISMIDDNEFCDNMLNIICNTTYGNDIINKITSDYYYDKEYDIFQNDLNNKQKMI